MVSLSARHWRIQMTSRERRLKEGRLYREVMNEVFKGNDLEIWMVRDGLEMSLGIAMNNIFDYIEGCLQLYDNPLSHLRWCFPDFIWKFREDIRADKLASALGDADYIWVMGGEVGEMFITAEQMARRKHRVLCFLSKTGEHSGWNSMVKKDLRDWVPGVRFVQDGDDETAGSIIS